MYTRVPSGQLPRGMRVPENYGGNAFRRVPPMDTAEPSPEKREESTGLEERPDTAFSAPRSHEDAPNDAVGDAPNAPVGARPTPFSLRLPFFGSTQGKGLAIGTEELLLLGLILLISQERGNDDLILLLILLLFIS